jgi:hypothetical protein
MNTKLEKKRKAREEREARKANPHATANRTNAVGTKMNKVRMKSFMKMIKKLQNN